MATRRSFAHAEKPQGVQPPGYRPSALDALASLVKRGGHDIHADLLQKKMPQKPLTPVAQEAIGRIQQPQMPPQMPPQAPESYPRVVPGVSAAQQPQEVPADDGFRMPPVPDYYNKVLEKIIERNPAPKGQPDWRKDALAKFAEIRSSLDRIKEYVESLDRGARNA